MIKRLFKEEEGQALTEYGLIIGLIAVVCIAALGVLGTEISGLFNRIGEKLGTTAPTTPPTGS
jgi:pilus assembly protein Flp/PilA